MSSLVTLESTFAAFASVFSRSSLCNLSSSSSTFSLAILEMSSLYFFARSFRSFLSLKLTVSVVNVNCCTVYDIMFTISVYKEMFFVSSVAPVFTKVRSGDADLSK